MAEGGSGGGTGGVAIVAIVVLVVIGLLAGGYVFMRGGTPSPVHTISGSVSTPAGPISGNAVTH